MENYYGDRQSFVRKKDFKTKFKKALKRFSTKRQYKRTKDDAVKKNNWRKIKKRIAKVSIIITTIIGVIALGWFFLYSRVFEFSKININLESYSYYDAVDNILQDQLKTHDVIKQNNYFTFDKGKFKDSVNELLVDVFYDIEIKKHFPNELSITLVERTPKVVFINSIGKFYFDEKGILTSVDLNKQHKKSEKAEQTNVLDGIESENPDVELPQQTIEEVYLEQSIELKNNNVTESMVSFLTKIRSKLQNKSIEVEKISLEVINDLKVIVSTKTGYDIYFNIADDIDNQIENLETVINNKIQDKIKNIQYIDLRFESKIYYK